MNIHDIREWSEQMQAGVPPLVDDPCRRDAEEDAKASAIVYGRSRVFEWYAAWTILGWGIILFLPGNSLSSSGWAPFPWSEMRTAFTMTGVGGIWVAALWINGSWKETPIIRAGAAIVGASIFAMLSTTLYIASLKLGYISTGFLPYGLAAGFCLFCAYRAGQDARLLHR